jgi:diguanylate cyclase (GGDEF)-like protein
VDTRAHQRTAEELAALARRVVALGIAVCAPVLVAIWFTDGGGDPWVRWGYPPMSAGLLVFAWVLLRRPLWTVRAALVALLALDAWWLAMTVAHVLGAPDAESAWVAVLPSPLLNVAVNLIVGFLFLSTRRAVQHGAAYTSAVVVALAAAFLRLPGGDAYLWPVARFGVYLAVVLILLLALARAKEQVTAAVARAARADAMASQMRDIAYLDELTGIANRRRLIEELGHQAQLVGPEHPVSVVYFDLDHFKQLNDTHGHTIGDAALRVVAEVASREVRDGDLLARLGGEEFVVVAPGTDRTKAEQLAERLRRRLPDALEAAVGERLTASFGVSVLEPGEAPAAALGRVDVLMYRAKAAGRDRVHVAGGLTA